MTQTTYRVTLINAADGSVHGHRTGCRDIAREGRKAFAGEPWSFPTTSKLAAWLDYNGDFLPECDSHDECDEAHGVCANAYDIDWKPCADGVPDYDVTACEWFALCDRPAVGTVAHPALGAVPTCQHCADRFDLELVAL